MLAEDESTFNSGLQAVFQGYDVQGLLERISELQKLCSLRV